MLLFMFIYGGEEGTRGREGERNEGRGEENEGKGRSMPIIINVNRKMGTHSYFSFLFFPPFVDCL